jgi:hypothetical protein
LRVQGHDLLCASAQPGAAQRFLSVAQRALAIAARAQQVREFALRLGPRRLEAKHGAIACFGAPNIAAAAQPPRTRKLEGRAQARNESRGHGLRYSMRA